MRLRLHALLICPIDKTPLELVSWETAAAGPMRDEVAQIRKLGLDPSLFSNEIVTGVLVNRHRRSYYPS